MVDTVADTLDCRSMPQALSQLKPRKPPAKLKEKTWATQKVVEVSLQSSKGEGTPTHVKPSLVFYEGDSKEEDYPMVSGTIIPIITQVEILVPSSGVRGPLMALLNLGCTRCLISIQTVEKLGLRSLR